MVTHCTFLPGFVSGIFCNARPTGFAKVADVTSTFLIFGFGGMSSLKALTTSGPVIAFWFAGLGPTFLKSEPCVPACRQCRSGRRSPVAVFLGHYGHCGLRGGLCSRAPVELPTSVLSNKVPFRGLVGFRPWSRKAFSLPRDLSLQLQFHQCILQHDRRARKPASRFVAPCRYAC